MKLKFNILSTNNGKVDISLDGGQTYKTYQVEDIAKNQNRIELDDKQDFTKIIVRGNTEIFTNLEVLHAIEVEKDVSATISD